LVLLKTAQLCDRKAQVLERLSGIPLIREAWGAGEEVRIRSAHSLTGAEESLFFDQDDQLVGVFFIFPSGLDLTPYPVLRKTLSQLRPAIELTLNVTQVASRERFDPAALYETGDATSTVRYLVLKGEPPVLLASSFAIDPYARLLSPYRAELLRRIERGGKGGKGLTDREAFQAMQQFARGEAAHFGSCGVKDDRLAVEAYRNAIAVGFKDPVWLAEAHHKLGLALERSGQLEAAKTAIEKALEIRPHTPEFLNSLGSVLMQKGDRTEAVAAFERAIALRPNYPVARFNLAQAYEAVNPRRAIAEYETYLALVEGVEEERPRATRAVQRIKELKGR
jgi:hypothetical protein